MPPLEEVIYQYYFIVHSTRIACFKEHCQGDFEDQRNVSKPLEQQNQTGSESH